VRCLATTQERTNNHRPTAYSSQDTDDVRRHAPDALQQDDGDSTTPWMVGTAVATASAAGLLYLYRQALRGKHRAERELAVRKSKHVGLQLSLIAHAQQEIDTAEMRAGAMVQRARRYHRELHRYRAATASMVSLETEPPLGGDLAPAVRDFMLRCIARFFEYRQLKGVKCSSH
jgi:hypothetical protein